jgi:integrase
VRPQNSSAIHRLMFSWSGWDGSQGENTPLNRHNFFRRCYKPLLEEAGLPRTVRFHDLRHTCATLLLSKNVNPKIVQELLGHANISQTMDTYSHILPDMQELAASAMDDILP